MGRFIDDGNGQFRIEYRHPLGGVDSSAPPQFIEGNKVVQASNILIREGTYAPAQPLQVPWGGAATCTNGNDFIGFGELPFLGASNGGVYLPSGYFYITATYAGGNATLTAWQAGDLQGSVPANIGSVTLPIASQLGRLTFITINQVVYLSAPGLTGICQIAPVPGSPTFAFIMTLLTNFLGCSFLREMSGRLVAMNVWQVVSTVPTNYPYQIAWSADSQQYGVWNVLDISGNPTGAGFNNLPDVEDVITGATFVGPTAYIYRQQGITEMTETNSGIQPFVWNHLWASEKGIGTTYANSLSQYGSESAFVSDSDIFSFGMSGLSSISGTAKQAIFSTLVQSSNQVLGLMSVLQFDGEPEMYYILVMQNPTAVAGVFNTVFWMYSYISKEWTQTILTNTVQFVPIQDAHALSKILTDGVTNANLASGILPVFAFQASTLAPIFYYFPDPPATTTTLAELVFPVELIAPYRDVTIDAIIVYTDDTSGSFIEMAINGSTYQTIIADGTSNQASGGYYKSFPSDGSPSKTFQNLQLIMTIAGVAQVGHVVLYGTQTPQRPV